MGLPVHICLLTYWHTHSRTHLLTWQDSRTFQSNEWTNALLGGGVLKDQRRTSRSDRVAIQYEIFLLFFMTIGLLKISMGPVFSIFYMFWRRVKTQEFIRKVLINEKLIFVRALAAAWSEFHVTSWARASPQFFQVFYSSLILCLSLSQFSLSLSLSLIQNFWQLYFWLLAIVFQNRYWLIKRSASMGDCKQLESSIWLLI